MNNKLDISFFQQKINSQFILDLRINLLAVFKFEITKTFQ